MSKSLTCVAEIMQDGKLFISSNNGDKIWQIEKFLAHISGNPLNDNAIILKYLSRVKIAKSMTSYRQLQQSLLMKGLEDNKCCSDLVGLLNSIHDITDTNIHTIRLAYLTCMKIIKEILLDKT